MSFNPDYVEFDEVTGDFLPIDKEARQKTLKRCELAQKNQDKLAVRQKKLDAMSDNTLYDTECQAILKTAQKENRKLTQQEAQKIHNIVNIARFRLNMALQKRR